MNSALLAAGQSKRLKPITYNTPKPLLTFLGKSFLSHIMDQHHLSGLEPKFVVINKDFTALFQRNFPALSILVQDKPLGTADAAKIVLEASEDKTILLQYGDNYVSYNGIHSMQVAHRSEIATIGVIRVKDPTKYGVVELDKNGHLVKVLEKPTNPPSNLVLAGIYIFERDMVDFLKEVKLSPRGEFELTDALNMAALKNDINVVMLDEEAWYDLTYPWDILKINRMLMGKMREEVKGEMEGNSHVEGPIYLGDGSVVKSGSYIEGPVWIGDDVTIGPNTYLRPYTSIADHSRVGNACEVKNSVLYSTVHAAHLTYIGDSVIGEGSNLGAGTITANLRFDERSIRVQVLGSETVDSGLTKLGCFMGPGVKTGVNVTINPGIKIGAGAIIYPGCVVTRDVLDHEIYRC